MILFNMSRLSNSSDEFIDSCVVSVYIDTNVNDARLGKI